MFSQPIAEEFSRRDCDVVELPEAGWAASTRCHRVFVTPTRWRSHAA